jgi:hypothetical protein
MGVGFQIPIKNLVSILISTAVKTVVSEQFGKLTVTLVEVSFPSQV